MTALTFIIEPEQICIAMDTLVVGSDDKKPMYFQRKFLVHSKNNFVAAGTGSADFINGWFDYIEKYLQESTIDDLDRICPEVFRSSVKAAGGLDGLTATIYHFGYSPSEGKYLGIAYRSTANFASHRLDEFSVGMKPPLSFELPDKLELPNLFVQIMKQQQAADKELSINDQVGIGGEIEFVYMRDKQIQISTVYKFESYHDEEAIIKSLLIV